MYQPLPNKMQRSTVGLVRGFIRLIGGGLIAAAGFASIAHAGTWQLVAPERANPGDRIEADLVFTGDGTTTDTQVTVVFDAMRLRVVQRAGVINGPGNGLCARSAGNRIVALLSTADGRPLPREATLACRIPFEVREIAPWGRAETTPITPICAAPAGLQACELAEERPAIVIGTPPAPPPPAAEREAAVYALLQFGDDVPTAEDVAWFDYSADREAPLQAFREVRPHSVRTLALDRARGDFAAFLARYPDSAHARLQRYVTASYRDQATAQRAVDALRRDPAVSYADLAPRVSGPAAGPVPKSQQLVAPRAAPKDPELLLQDHRDMLGIDAAWQWAGGWALVGVADSGLQVNHPELRAVDGTSFIGGPFIRALSYDAGNGLDTNPGTQVFDRDRNVDERQVTPLQGPGVPECLLPPSVCNIETPGYPQCMYPQFAGHGSHVSGLLAANAENVEARETKGVCRYCSLSAVKVSFHECDLIDDSPITYSVVTKLSGNAIAMAMDSFSKSGVVGASLSFGFVEASALPFGYCSVDPANILCTSAKALADSDVAVVAAAANDRTVIRYPGSDVRFLNVVGVNEARQFWDRSPPNPDPNTATCPTPGSNIECGSNFQANAGFRLPDVAAQAANVYSVAYAGADWNGGCGDSFDSYPFPDGKGLCTGTSMSTPQVAGVLGILRSINPLVRAVNPSGTTPSPLQQVLYDSGDRSLANPPLPRDFRFGFGILDAEEAVKRMLGRVRGETVRNRVTPMFSLYNAALQDHASTPTPQAAMALIRYGSFAYSPDTVPGVLPTPGYAAYPYDESTTAPPPPKAAFYVLPDYGQGALLALSAASPPVLAAQTGDQPCRLR